MRQWHGTPGYFFNYNPALYTCNDSTYGTACDTTIYDQYSLSASQTKYCEASYSVGGTFLAAMIVSLEPEIRSPAFLSVILTKPISAWIPTAE